MSIGLILQLIKEEWKQINFGSNTWKQLDTNGATRDEEYTSSNRQVELFVQEGEGDNTWLEYVGRLEYRDGFIEIRDSDWNEVARAVDPDNPNALTWSDLTLESSTSYVEGLEAAWDKIGDYLPSAPFFVIMQIRLILMSVQSFCLRRTNGMI